MSRKGSCSGGWRAKEGSESTLLGEGSAQSHVSRSGGGGGAQADLERLLLTEGGASAGATGEMPKGFRTKRQEKGVRMRGMWAKTEQE